MIQGPLGGVGVGRVLCRAAAVSPVVLMASSGGNPKRDMDSKEDGM
jgi:hypothetical protein